MLIYYLKFINFVVILNANKIKVTGKKAIQKLYYRNSQRPGGLKIETFTDLQNRIPSRILEESIWGMLPKGVLGRQYYRRLYIYSTDKITYKKLKTDPSLDSTIEFEKNWIKVEL